MRSIPQSIVEALSERKKTGTALELKDTYQTLKQALQSFNKVFICIDALDERTDEHRWSLIDRLQQIAIPDSSTTAQSPLIKLFFTGRSQIEAQVNLRSKIRPFRPLSVKLEASKEDIIRFIHHRIDMDQSRHGPSIEG